MDMEKVWRLVDRLDNRKEPEFKFGGSFMAGHGSTEEMGKTALVPQKEEKGELSMGPMVTSGEKSKDYSASIDESVSLVGKSTGMPMTTSGGFAPQTAGVGQMKLEAPPQYSGKRQPGARVWLTYPHHQNHDRGKCKTQFTWWLAQG